MGNCQAAEAATVVIQHPGSKIERIYWSVSANEIMNSNPGHYVALVVTSPTMKSENGLPLKQLKLLRPDDTLSIGNVYRLLSFEDVLKEFAAKKCMKLGRLIKERGPEWRLPKPNPTRNSKTEKCSYVRAEVGVAGSSNRVGGRHHGVGGSGGQWKPALQSIAEIGT
ncbi:uncharacterized protein LOC123199637 [Mangifera indica]|uniref:uncharacterized protein LOC123199637 n=1 Tax=Mangifera indica TaxID=29780 RepID=UPI001CFB8461|nr:uncharacterized protein LOC123199637 [Mangifera indica]